MIPDEAKSGRGQPHSKALRAARWIGIALVYLFLLAAFAAGAYYEYLKFRFFLRNS